MIMFTLCRFFILNIHCWRKGLKPSFLFYFIICSSNPSISQVILQRLNDTFKKIILQQFENFQFKNIFHCRDKTFVIADIKID